MKNVLLFLLTYIYGIGITTSKQILAAANVSEDTRVRDLSNDELDRIRAEVDKLKLKVTYVVK